MIDRDDPAGTVHGLAEQLGEMLQGRVGDDVVRLLVLVARVESPTQALGQTIVLVEQENGHELPAEAVARALEDAAATWRRRVDPADLPPWPE